MRRASYAVCILLVGLLIAGVCGAQEQALERVKSESARVQQSALPPSQSDFWKGLKAARDRSADFHAAVRDWIESILPKSKAALDAELSFLNPRVTTDLQLAGLIIKPNWADENSKSGFVSRVELSRPREDSNKLTVIVGVSVPCGSDDVVYVYDYGQGQPRRVLESHGTRDHDESLSDVRFSKRNAGASQLILTLRYGVQCASTWNTLSFDLFRLSPTNTAAPILGGEHGIWFGDEQAYQVRLDPVDLLMEVRDRSIDDGIHNRLHVLHFNLASSEVERTDPIALQPQDFVDEWLTRPWSEMESRSADGARETLKQWHEFLANDFVAGEFTIVQSCIERRDEWQIGVNLNSIKGKAIPEPLSVYFLVKQLEQYRFKMVGINFERQEGCPGESLPSTESPSLFLTSQTTAR
jgi:hypothetical protein